MSVTTKKAGADPSTEEVPAGESSGATMEGTAGTMVNISAQAYAPTGMRLITVEVDRPDGSYAAHGARSVNYDVAITAATAGVWRVTALYSDGSRAVFEVTLAVQS